MIRLFTTAFWQEAGGAIARTFLAALTPLVPALVANPTSPSAWILALATAGPVTIVAALHALAGLPSVASGVWWEVALQRSARQFGQYLIAALPATFLLDGIDWKSLVLAAAGSAVATFFIAASTIVSGGTLTDDDTTVTVASTTTDSTSTDAVDSTDSTTATDAGDVEEVSDAELDADAATTVDSTVEGTTGPDDTTAAA